MILQGKESTDMKMTGKFGRLLGIVLSGVMLFIVLSSSSVAAENLIVNGDAETGDLTGWKESKAYTVGVWKATDYSDRGGQVTGPHSGNYFFIPVASSVSGDYDTFLFNDVLIPESAKPGDVFEISCYAHTYADDTEVEKDFGRLYLRFCYPDGTYMPDENGNPKCMFKYETIEGTANWKRYSVQMKMPEGAGDIQYGIWASQRDGGGFANVSFDDIVLVNLGQ
jgi:hypothetical protein